MKILRAPDSAFAGLPDFPFAPHYLEIDQDGTKLRVHFPRRGTAQCRSRAADAGRAVVVAARSAS